MGILIEVVSRDTEPCLVSVNLSSCQGLRSCDLVGGSGSGRPPLDRERVLPLRGSHHPTPATPNFFSTFGRKKRRPANRVERGETR